MNFNKILEDLKLIASRLNSISLRSSDDYPLIPSNIVAIKKAQSLEKDLISLKKKSEILQLENDKLISSVQRISDEINSINFINKKEICKSESNILNKEEIYNSEDDFAKENCIIQNNIPEESR